MGTEIDRRSPWPPFQRGLAGITHGANSERLVSAASAELREHLISLHPWIEEEDAIVVDLLCREMARYNMLSEWMAGVEEGSIESLTPPYTGPEAIPEKVLRELRLTGDSVAKLCNSLGLDPSGRMKIHKDAGFALALSGQKAQNVASAGRALRLNSTEGRSA